MGGGHAAALASALMNVVREGYLARQKYAHLSKNKWKYMANRIYEHQKGRGLNQTGGFGVLPALAAKWIIGKVIKKVQGGSGIRRKNKTRRRRQTRSLLLQ